MRSFRCCMILVCIGGMMAAPALGDAIMSLSGPTQALSGDTGLVYKVYGATDGGTVDVRGYQSTFPCEMLLVSGSGSVDYVAGSIAIIQADPDYIFAGITAFPTPAPGDCSADPPDLPRFSNATMFASDAKVVGTTPYYLGEIQYDVNAPAPSTFELCIEPDPASFFRDPAGNGIPFTSPCLTLDIVECFENSHCDDGDPCNGEETCVANACVAGTTLVCFDDNECTSDDCTTGVGCEYLPEADGFACDNGNGGTMDCDNPDSCMGGVCMDNNEPDGTGCTDDGNVCTDDVCSGGFCVNNPNSAPCDDTLFCNGTDTCGGGTCSIHSGDPCAAGGECADECDESMDWCYDAAGTPCTDDGDVCTDDECDGMGACGHPYNTAPCDDGDLCTEDDTCDMGVCAGAPKDCDDGEPCTEDSCNPITGECVHINICEVEVCLGLVDEGLRDQDNCVESDGAFKVGIHLSGAVDIVGAQFRLVYDPALLTLLAVEDGSACDPASPFTHIIHQDAGDGWVWIATETGEPIACVDDEDCLEGQTCDTVQGFCEPIADASDGNTDVACLTFEFATQCDPADVCFEDLNPMTGRLVNIWGDPVPLNHGDLKDCTCEWFIPETDTSIVCPADINMIADCSETTREIYFDCPYAVDKCGEAKLIGWTCTPLTGEPCKPEWLENCGGEFPQGSWLFTATGADNECFDGNEVCSFTVSVSEWQQLNVEVEVSPNMDPGPFTRCIEFKMWEYCTPMPSFSTFKADMVFGGAYNFEGHATAEIKVPKGQYWCLQARDQLHTLWNSTEVACDDGVYEAIFKGDPYFGGNWLTSGNLDGLAPDDSGWSPRAIDIVEYGLFVSQFLTKPGADTLCDDKPLFWEAGAAHADINGDGAVDDLDFSFISVNFLACDKGMKCCPEAGRDIAGNTSMTVRDLTAMGIGDACDLNRDGVCDTTDMGLFQEGMRPKTNLRPSKR